MNNFNHQKIKKQNKNKKQINRLIIKMHDIIENYLLFYYYLIEI
jgi:hypothetical protein